MANLRYPRHRFALAEEATMRETADEFDGVRVKPLNDVLRHGVRTDIAPNRRRKARSFERARAARRRFIRA